MAVHVQAANYEKICDMPTPIYCPAEDSSGNLHVISSNGDVYMVHENSMDLIFSTSGQPTGIVFDPQGNSFIADAAHQAIISQTDSENRIDISPLVKEFEGDSLIGPNSLLLSEETNTLFFTDSGPFGETSLQNPKGSIFAIDLELNEMRPIMHHSLAYPCGLTMSNDQARLYVAETCRNRILRLVQHPAGVFHSSVFHQFSGRFGPTAIAMHSKGYLFVARYDFSDGSNEGIISVLAESGEIIMEYSIPECPEITGLCFSKQNENILYVTEITHNSLLKLLVNLKQFPTIACYFCISIFIFEAISILLIIPAQCEMFEIQTEEVMKYPFSI